MEMIQAASQALVIMMDPMRLGFLALGVFIGLILGVIPGLGGWLQGEAADAFRHRIG